MRSIDLSIPDSSKLSAPHFPYQIFTVLTKMLFSKSIAVFATLAFGAISSLAAPVVDNTAIVARCDACDAQKGVAGVLVDVKAAVSVYVEEFSEYFFLLPSRS